MNLVQIYLEVKPNRLWGKDINLEVKKQEIFKETPKQIKMDKSFGHQFLKVINKELLNKIHSEEISEQSVNSIKRWVYIKEDENYNEEKLKQQLKNSILEEINKRRSILNDMENLIMTLK